MLYESQEYFKDCTGYLKRYSVPSSYKQNSNAGGVLGMIQEIIDESAGGERRRGRLQPTATFHISGVLVLFSVLNVFFFNFLYHTVY